MRPIIKYLAFVLLTVNLYGQQVPVTSAPIDFWAEYGLVVDESVTSDMFLSNSPGAESTMDIQTILAISYLARHYSTHINITSAGRLPAYNPGSSKSKHLFPNPTAVDFRFLDQAAAEDFRRQLEVRAGPVFETLLQMGIRGFGMYSAGFFHIDARKNANMFIFESIYGPMSYNMWSDGTSYLNISTCRH